MTDTDTTRRSLLRAISVMPALGVIGAAAGSQGAFAATAPGISLTKVGSPLAGGTVAKPSTVSARGTNGLFMRMDDLDLESYQDFLCGRSLFTRKLMGAAADRSEAILWEHGIDPTKPTDMAMADIATMLQNDPVIERASRFSIDNHYDAFVRLQAHFHANGDYYASLFDASDKKGPGVLKLSPGLDAPDYTKHEIHNQVGGYMGDPFAGPMYYYGTLVLNDGANEQDYMFDTIAQNMPLPADGKVRRILENGTGTGQLTTSLRRRFPDAEIWGIDVSGPMLRYAHHRATSLGLNINYAQRLAEDNGFPDNYFDLITSSSFHHEVTADASAKIFKEAQRSLRPGGIFRPADSGIMGYVRTPLNMANQYMAYRVNHEVWTLEWGDMDRFGSMREAGLKVDPNGAPGADGGAGVWLKTISVLATKV